jgi:hypothetical protein
MQMLLSAAPLRFFVMMQNIYQVKYCSVIIRFVHSSRTIAAGGVRGWGDRLDAATAAEAETAHSLLRIAKGGAPASSTSKPNRTHQSGPPASFLRVDLVALTTKARKKGAER